MNYRNVALCLAIALLGSMAFRLQMPAVSFYARYVLQSSAFIIGLFTAAFMLSRAATAVFTGRLYSKKSFARVAAPIGFLAGSVLAWAFTFLRSVWGFTLLRVLQGVANGIAWVMVQIVLGASVEESRRATVYAIYFSIGIAGVSIANLLYSVLYTKGFDFLMTLSSALFLCVAALSSLLRPPRAEPAAARGRGASGGAVATSFKLCIVPLAIIFLTQIAIALPGSGVVYVYMKEVFGLSKSLTTRIVAIALAISIAMGIGLSYVADRVSERRALATAVALLIAGCAVIPLRILWLATVAFAALLSSARATISIVRRIAMRLLGARGIGYVNAAGNLGFVVGSLTMGVAYDRLGPSSLDGVIVESALVPYAPLTAVFVGMLRAVMKYFGRGK